MQLQMRPVQARLASRTRGHAVVIMRSYKIVQVAEGGDSTRRELARRWQDLDATVQEGLDELKTLCMMQMVINGKPMCHCLPQPRASVHKFLEKAQVVLPAALPHRGVQVATRKKLQLRRKTR